MIAALLVFAAAVTLGAFLRCAVPELPPGARGLRAKLSFSSGDTITVQFDDSWQRRTNLLRLLAREGKHR
jgi:hypothetical protein